MISKKLEEMKSMDEPEEWIEEDLNQSLSKIQQDGEVHVESFRGFPSTFIHPRLFKISPQLQGDAIELINKQQL